MKDFPAIASQISVDEPSPALWRDKLTYKEMLLDDYLSPLEKAAGQSGAVPREIQTQVLERLHWYFTVDRRERAPTVVVNQLMTVEFHDIVGQILRHIDIETLVSLDSQHISTEVKHALLSYKKPHCHSSVALDAYDRDQGLLRATYYLHGDKPSEVFLLDGKEVKPAFAKYRACNYFRRMLLRQRIVWLPVADEKDIEIRLDGQPVEISLDKINLISKNAANSFTKFGLLDKARLTFLPGRGCRQSPPFNLSGLKARLLLWLAHLSPIRKRFQNAWVFADRDIDADDNAEHLYRWVQQHHPEINAWFLLSRKAPDWSRLQHEGFRLVPSGWWNKLLFLNSDCILSSHTDHAHGDLAPEVYGKAMNWRFVFLQHGVTKDDMSHWLSNQPFDLFVTTSPEEYASIVEDDTPYTYTAREVSRTGFPRHDTLLTIARDTPSDEIDTILVMPTWRGNLSDGRHEKDEAINRLNVFADSEYAKRWGELLCNKELHDLLARHNKRLVFMPHPNAVPFLSVLKLPKQVEVLTKADIGIQRLFAKCLAMITDYSSVAFEMAYLRRPVIYYQFDFDSYYSGDHNWREGYYDYSNDGFGPRATEVFEVLREVQNLLISPNEFQGRYLERMERALPEQDGLACQRLWDYIIQIWHLRCAN